VIFLLNKASDERVGRFFLDERGVAPPQFRPISNYGCSSKGEIPPNLTMTEAPSVTAATMSFSISRPNMAKEIQGSILFFFKGS
jgi:hypothetical protein